MPRRKTIDRNPLETLAGEATRPRAARAVDDETTGPRVVAAWMRGTNSVLEAMLEAQNATLSAGLSVIEATVDINRAALADSIDLWDQAQRVTRALWSEEDGQEQEGGRKPRQGR